jgi:hypothetical protein
MNRPTPSRSTSSLPTDLLGILLLSLVLALLAGPASAASFLPSVQGIPGWEVRVITDDGHVLDGVVTGSMMNWQGVRRITLKDSGDTRHKLEARDIRQIVVPLDSPMARETLFFEATETLVKAARTDFRQIRDTDAMVFDTLAFPKPDRRVLLPLVNPAFGSRIRVYGLINEREWTHSIRGVKIWGDEPNAYVVVKDGGKPWKIEDGDYEDQVRELFGDCPEMMRQLSDDPDFDDMADHVLLYESLCGARQAS